MTRDKGIDRGSCDSHARSRDLGIGTANVLAAPLRPAWGKGHRQQRPPGGACTRMAASAHDVQRCSFQLDPMAASHISKSVKFTVVGPPAEP